MDKDIKNIFPKNNPEGATENAPGPTDSEWPENFFDYPKELNPKKDNAGENRQIEPLTGNFYQDFVEVFMEDSGGNKPNEWEMVEGFFTYFTELGCKFIVDKSSGSIVIFTKEEPLLLNSANHVGRNWFIHQTHFSLGNPKGRQFLQNLVDYLYSEERSSLVESAFFSTCDRQASFFFINNQDILRCMDGNVDVIRNGRNESNIGLLSPTLPYEEWAFDPDTSDEKAIKLLDERIIKYLALERYDALHLTAFTLAGLSPSHAVRPLLLHNGSSASGKTDAAKLFSTLFNGKINLGSFASPDELSAIMDKNFYCVIDNQETDRASSRRFFDLYCVTTTGGGTTKRKLYTDSELIRSSLRGLLVITCIRSPDQPELINRSVLFEFSSKYHQKQYNFEAIKQGILDNRSEILSGIYKLYAAHVQTYKNDYSSFADEYLSKIKHPRSRLNSYLREFLLWLKVLSSHLDFDFRESADAFFKKSNQEFKTSVYESDTVMFALNSLVEEIKTGSTHQMKVERRTEGKWLHMKGFASDFFADLCRHVSGSKSQFPTPRTLGQRLKGISNDVIKEYGWEIKKDYSKLSKGIIYDIAFDTSNWKKRSDWLFGSDLTKHNIGYFGGGQVPPMRYKMVFNFVHEVKEAVQKQEIEILEIDEVGKLDIETINWISRLGVKIVINGGNHGQQ